MKASLSEEAFFASVQKLSLFGDGDGEATTVPRTRRSTLVAECNGAASVRSLLPFSFCYNMYIGSHTVVLQFPCAFPIKINSEVSTMKEAFSKKALSSANEKCDKIIALLISIPMDDETFGDLDIAFQRVWDAKQSIEKRLLIEYARKRAFACH